MLFRCIILFIGKTLYAIVLGLSQEAINLETLKVNNVTKEAKIQLLGSTDKITYIVNDDNTLTIHPPKLGRDQQISKYAVVFKLTGFDLDIHP